MSIENISNPVGRVPMKPKFRVLPLISAGEEGVIERVVSHRFDLVPTVTVDSDFFGLRSNQEGYVYRRGILRDNAILVKGSYGKEQKGRNREGAYQVETSYLARHPGALSSYLPTHHGEWYVVTFKPPTSDPPERLPLERRSNPRWSRGQKPPRN